MRGGVGVGGRGRERRRGGEAIRQGVAVLGADLEAGTPVEVGLAPGRQAYVLAAHGRVSLGDVELALRDGAVVDDVETFSITALDDSDVLVIDVPC